MDVERLRSLRFEYENQFVIVEGDRPELLRFKGKIGQVKTVNCNGRALVQFNSGADRGWYDIDLDFLRVVDPPVNKGDSAESPASPDRLSQEVDYRPSALELARQAKGQGSSVEKNPLRDVRSQGTVGKKDESR